MLEGKPSRRLWIVALVVSALCVAGLAYGLVTDWNTPAQRPLERGRAVATGSGFGLGLGIGLGVGVLAGSLLAARRKS